jgi:hypothetical protein
MSTVIHVGTISRPNHCQFRQEKCYQVSATRILVPEMRENYCCDDIKERLGVVAEGDTGRMTCIQFRLVH